MLIGRTEETPKMFDTMGAAAFAERQPGSN
jgi:hypothetical protein